MFLHVQYISRKGFRVCVKELYEAKYDPLTISYIVLSGKNFTAKKKKIFTGYLSISSLICDSMSWFIRTDICPDGWDYFNGYCYLTSSVCEPWVTAVSNCSAMNSHLVTVHNQEENVYIQHRHNSERSWIGLNDRSVEGSFVWTNKEIISFQFWAPQQPNNLKNEDCVHTLGAKDGYSWNDVSCDNCYNYTCVKGKFWSSCHRDSTNPNLCHQLRGLKITSAVVSFYDNIVAVLLIRILYSLPFMKLSSRQ